MTDTGSIIRRAFFLVLLISLGVFNVFGSFRGLDTIHGMEHAQLSREIARGKDFKTKVIRPAAIWQYERGNSNTVDFVNMRDTYHAPLSPLVTGAVLKTVDGDDANKWRMGEEEYVYGLDRVIAAISALFFIMAVGVNYLLIGRIFDSKIAGTTGALLMLCNLMWDFTKSGLPQMLMLLLFSCAALFLFQAIESKNEGKSGAGSAILAGTFLILICLTHWLAVWIFVGYLIFATVYFSPRGLISIVLVALFAVLAAYPLFKNYEASGTVFGSGYLTLYDGLGSIGSEDQIMRETNLATQSLDLRGLLKKITVQTLSQANYLYLYLGSIVVAPLFFLTLFHSFRRQAIGDFRWAIFLMWIFAAVGMAIFGLSDDTRDSNQMHVLFAPVMAAYGMAFFVIIWSRLKLGEGMESFKYAPHIIAVLVSSGPMMLNLPQQLKNAAFVSDKGFPHWPPYYPPGLNLEIPKLAASNEVVVTDQPWAVAWYADRTALWLPKTVQGFEQYQQKANEQKTPFAGILVTPYSHSMKKMRAVFSEYKDFLPLILDGKVQTMTQGTVAPFKASSQLRSLQSRYKYPFSIVGADMIFYGANPSR